MATTMQFVFVLFMLISTGVCDPVFKLVNSSLQLNVSKKLDDDLTWSLNQKENIVKYSKESKGFSAHGRFKGRVKFDTVTHSLTLFNVQKDDSGLYQAEYSGDVKEITATHEINVLDPVTKPVFNTSCLSNNNTYVTFTCEAQKLSITCSCNNNTCDIKEANETDAVLFLRMSISNNLIICNHSNPVSWKTTEINLMTQHCTSEEVHKKPTDSPNIILIAVVISIVLLAILIIGIICWRKKRETRDLVNTVYEEVDPMKKGENNTQSLEMSEKPEHPGTVYCTVGKPAEACSNDESTVRTANPGNKVMKRMRSKENCDDQNLCDTPDKIQNQETGNAYEELESSLPQTIYATVNKGFKPM